MKTTLLTSTLLSISLLSTNLFAGTDMVCNGEYCIVDLSNLSPEKSNQKVEKEVTVEVVPYVEEVETIVLPHEKYIMSDGDILESELEIVEEQLPVSEYFCENNLELLTVDGQNAYICS